MSNRAWVTLSTNDSYSLGALVLAHSLRRVGSVYPAVLLITPSVTDAMRERLRAVFTDVIVVDVLDSRDATHLALLQRPELGITFTKIHCWSLTQFEKCVFLDADTLVVQNCDELFEREELSAAPDVGWPDCFNSGVFVYRPSQGTFDALIQFAKERGSFDGGDQGLLNSYFSGWARGDINKHLPFLYNVTSAAFYSYLPALKHFGSDLKIIHFIGAAKPWLQTYNWESQSVDSAGHLKDTLQLWWEIFVSSVHPQLDVTMVGGGGPPELPPTDTLNYYVPEVDPDSIFPWHQMITTRAKEEEEKTKLDLSIFFDPWDLYRGDIPLKEEFQPSNVSRIPGRVEVTQELRDYVWQYKDQQQNSSTSNVHDTQELSSLELSERSHEHHDHHSHHSHRQLSLAPNESHSIHQPHFSHNHDSHFSHKQAHDSNVDDSSQSHHNYQHNDCQHDKEDYSLTGDTWISNTQVKSQNNHSLHRSEIHAPHLHGNHHNIEQVHHVRLDVQKRPLKIGKKKTKRLHRIDICDGTGVMNGDISSEDEEMEVEQPKHPYDGFYLRHRATIDPNGRKICTHQLPPTPPPSPPPESPESNDNEEVEQDLIDQQTGVAGNLARVVPGAISSQREVLDELTRRQGWEAGNIDYLGADSFDNIWAKISQTLNQAPKQASPPKEEAPTPETPASPLQDPSPPAKEPSPSNEQLPLAKQPSAAKEVTPDEPTSVKQSGPAKEASIEPKAQEIPATVEAVLTQPALAESPKEVAAVKTILSVTASAGQQKSESAIPATPPVTPSETASTTPVAETAPVLEALTPVEVPKTPEVETSLSKSEATPDKTLELSDVSTDSPPLANTPSKDEVQSPKAAKYKELGLKELPRRQLKRPGFDRSAEGERARKPAGKLQLRPPGIADPLPTPDSEFEDAASLAQSIIASELATPTVTSPTPPAPLTPASAPPALQQKRLSVDEPLPTTPPAGPVSLAQIGVKPKPSIAAQIESSVTDKPEVAIPPPEITTTPTTPSEPSTPTEVPKKKLVKKSVKKEGSGVGADAPVPPPRKKEKKPKEK